MCVCASYVGVVVLAVGQQKRLGVAVTAQPATEHTQKQPVSQALRSAVAGRGNCKLIRLTEYASLQVAS